MPGNAVTGLSFDTTSIQKADKAIENLVKKAEKGIGRVNKAWKDMTTNGLNHYIQRLAVAQNAMSKLSNQKINVRFSGQANDLKRLGDSARKAITHVNQLLTAMQRLARININLVGSGSGNISAMDAQKIKYLEDQIKLLEKQLDVQKKIGNAIGAQVNNTNKVTNSMNGLSNAARKLRHLTSTIFSIQALMGYGNKLLQIRGEFEMQHRSLQVLLQDVDKANELWDKTVALAVKSPFRVKQLVTYTKQLAAYRVESEKLYDTTRMLADVSAGLGVDMNRLILAFGQVKAANFLRGTELRQFSEAGVNMLEELAKRFTALEGRAVSVGDVFERVSKRMVSFKDVEAVFQTITSEGGVFYHMQEKQSETLRGMIMNLKDSIDLMFNDIGMSQDGALKGGVRLVKSLVDNWRDLLPLLKAVGVAFAVALPIKGLFNFIKGVTILIKNIKRVGVAMSMLKSANVWALLAGAVAGLITYLVSAKNKVDALNAAMGQIDRDVTKNLEESISLYRSLSDTVNDVTKKEVERNKALSQLQSKFAEILPDQMLELEYIKGISDNYEEATNALMNYYNAKAKEQKRDKIESEFAEEIEGTEIPDISKAILKRIELSEDFSERQKVKLSAGLSKVINDVINSAKSGEIANDIETLRQEINKGLQEFSGVEIDITKKDWFGFNNVQAVVAKNINDIVNDIARYKTAIEGVEGLGAPFETFEQYEASNLFLPEKEGIKEATTLFNQMLNDFSELSKKPLGEWGGIDKEFEIDLSRLPETGRRYEQVLRDMFERLKQVAATKGYDFTASLQGLQQEFKNSIGPELFSNVFENLSTMGYDGQDFLMVQEELLLLVNNTIDNINREAQKLDLTPFQRSLTEAMRVIAKETGVSVQKFTDFIPEMGESLSTAQKEVAAKVEQIKGDIKTWETSQKIDQKALNLIRPEVLTQTQATIDGLKQELIAFEMLRTYLGDADKDKKKDKTIDEKIKVVDQMNAKYKELNKTLSHGESLKGAFDAYKDAFATADKREDVRTMTPEQFAKNVLNFPNEDDVIAWLEKLAKTVEDQEDKFKVQMAQGKFEMDVRVRVKKEADKELKKEIDELFDQYDLFLDLEKLNIPKDVAKGLFDIDATSIEELRNNLVSRKDEFVGKDMLKEYEEYLKKLDDMEDKAQVDRLKKYLEYTRAAIGERAKIKVDEMNKLLEIEKAFKPEDLKKEHNIEKAKAEGKTDAEIEVLKKENEEIRKGNEETAKRNKLLEEQKGLAIQGVQEESKQKIQKQDWSDFKSSDTFINIFNDLDNASSDLINHAVTKIEKFKEQWTDMPIESAKEMALKLNELQLALLDTDKPLKDNKKLWGDLREEMEKRDIKGPVRSSKAQTKLTEAVTSENKDYEVEIEASNKRIAALQTINNLTAENKEQELAKIGYTKEYLEKLGLSSAVLTNNVEANQDLIKTEKNNIKANNDKIAANRKVLNTQKKISQNSKELNDAIETSKKLANDLYGSFKELVEALGGGDSPAMIFADMGMNMANTVLNTIMLQIQLNAATIAANGLGAAMNTAMGVIGWIVMAIQLLVQGITAAVNYSEKLRQMKLDILADQVDNLKQKYDTLAESIDKAYSLKQLRAYAGELDKLQGKMEKAQANYMLLLQEGDKSGKIDLGKQAQAKLDSGVSVNDLSKKERKALLSEEYKDYKEASEALLEMQKDHEEQKKEILESMGGVTDYRDATADFVEAWVDAFKETGDGLSGLKEHFTEFFDDLIAQQATMKVTEKFLEPFFENLNEYLYDYELTKDEMDRLRKQAESIAPELSEYLEELWNLLGGSGSEATGSLTALQKGIQGMTEEQAEVLSAYWNSVRGYTASIDDKIDVILSNLGMQDVNPQLIELQNQSVLLSEINNKMAVMNATIDSLLDTNGRLKVNSTSQLDTLLASRKTGGLGLKIVSD